MSEESEFTKKQGAERLEKACEIYYDMVEKKINDFQKVKSYLTNTLEELLQEEKIGNGVILLSRIKSPVSVVENWKLGKNLHDIFGITLLTQNQKEMDAIREKLRDKSEFDISSKKEMNKKRGYEAIHFLFHVENGRNKKTNVECHMQTHEAYKNVYPHILYKVRRALDRNLTPDEENEVKDKIQSMFESEKLSGRQVGENKKARLPQMWVSSFNDDGKMEEIELNETHKLLIMYPFLDLSKTKTFKAENKEPGSGER